MTLTAVFSGGRVRRYNELQLQGTTGNYWQANDVDQRETGYDSPANGSSNRQAWDMRFRRGNNWLLTDPIGGDGSRTIVEFPEISVGNIEARTPSNASRQTTVGGYSRYIHEKVRINLRSATGTSGEEVD